MATHQQSGLLLGPVAVNGFPARQRNRAKTYQGGEWVMAYQAEQRTRLRAVFLRQQRQQKRQGERSWALISPPTNTREASGVGRRALDRELLMRHCFVEQPSDLSHADITGLHLNKYKPEDLGEFDSLVHMTASDSALPMEAFKTFPVLEQLELCVCGISDISLSPSDFLRLQRLDLSYNAVSGEAVLVLGTLPQLRELHLTGNDIVALPVEMSRPFKIPREPPDTTSVGSSSMEMRFAALETLWLDDNKLTDQTTFSTLAGLRKLKYVNLDNNELYTVPQLRLIGTSRLRPEDDRHSENSLAQRPSSSSNTESRAGSLSEAKYQSVEMSDHQGDVGAVTENKPDMMSEETKCEAECVGDASDSGEVGAYGDVKKEEATAVEERRGTAETERTVSVTGLPPSMAPFPCLHTLSLANNLFFSSEGLLACGMWPALKQLIIHGNPLISMCKGMPPRLQLELVQKKNIHITRHKPKPKAFQIREKAKSFKKIPAEPGSANDGLCLPAPSKSPLALAPPQSASQESSTTHSHTSATAEPVDNAEAGVFITQGTSEQDNAPKVISTEDSGKDRFKESRSSTKREMMEWKGAVREKYATSDLPRQFRGYEALLEEDSLPVPHIPTDLQGCMHALRYSLRHGSTYKPVASLKHTYRHRQTMEGQQLMASRETATHNRVQEMHKALDEVRRSTATLQANLADLLGMSTSADSTTHQLQREGKHLLEQLQAKYDVQRDKITTSKSQTK